MNTDFLWVEEYRPKTIDDCILPTSLKTLFKSFIKKGELSNLNQFYQRCPKNVFVDVFIEGSEV